MIARADIRMLFNGKGKLLPPDKWPDEIAPAVESCTVDAKGVTRVKFISKLPALRLVLELTGKLRAPGDGLRDIADVLADIYDRHAEREGRS
jgi:hypothetical protein